jgi:hypothetical protein
MIKIVVVCPAGLLCEGDMDRGVFAPRLWDTSVLDSISTPATRENIKERVTFATMDEIRGLISGAKFVVME